MPWVMVRTGEGLTLTGFWFSHSIWYMTAEKFSRLSHSDCFQPTSILLISSRRQTAPCPELEPE